MENLTTSNLYPQGDDMIDTRHHWREPLLRAQLHTWLHAKPERLRARRAHIRTGMLETVRMATASFIQLRHAARLAHDGATRFNEAARAADLLPHILEGLVQP
jgi:hypothetical protein